LASKHTQSCQQMIKPLKYSMDQKDNQVFDKLIKLFNFNKNFVLVDVDFTKPWFQILLHFKYPLSLLLLNEIVFSSFFSVYPLLITKAIESNSVFNFIIVVLVYIFLKPILLYSIYNATGLIASIKSSVQTSSYNFLIMVDPLFHTTRSSGQIITKINKGSLVFDQMITIFITDLISYLGTLFGIIIALTYINSLIGLVAFLFISIIVLFSIYTRKNLELIRSQPLIKSEDKLVSLQIESLTQVQFIRTLFYTPEQSNKLKEFSKQNLIITSTHDFSASILGMTTRIFYSIGLLMIGLIGFWLYQKGEISILSFISGIFIFYSGETAANRIGKSYDTFLSSKSRIIDLYKFINNFGQQTYPVLPTNDKIPKL
jgi:ABC-type multidrug transport system fused ATPase/permease subunit